MRVWTAFISFRVIRSPAIVLPRSSSVCVAFVFNFVSCESPLRVYLNELDWNGAVSL